MTARKLAAALGSAVRRGDPSSFGHFYQLAVEADVISVVDDFLARVEAADLPREGVAAVARRLAMEARDLSPAKLAVALLGVAGEPGDCDLLLMLGRYDEFTLYAAVSVGSLLDQSEDAIWSLAKNTRGWGRIQAVLRLEGTDRADIKDWLLREGHRTDVMAEEVAYFCAVTGGLVGALRSPDTDEALIESLSELFQALVAGGPAEDIRDYPEAPEVAQLFLKKLQVSPEISFSRFLAAKALESWLDEPQQSNAGRPQLSPEKRWSLRSAAAAYQRRPEWLSLVEKHLTDQDEGNFWNACSVGELLGMDVWPRRLERQRQGESAQWYFLMQTDSQERIEDVLSLAREQLDLASVASGPSLSMGFGPDFEDDRAVDAIVQELRRFPGLGWDFLHAGFSGRSVRLRNMTIQALEAWGAEAWPAEAWPLLQMAVGREPDEEVRERFAQLLKSASAPLNP